MHDTDPLFLKRLQSPTNDREWHTLLELYSPLVRGWLRSWGLAVDDAEDLVQEVLAVLVRRLADFDRGERPGSFRRWLKNIALNCVRSHWRNQRKRLGSSGSHDSLQEQEDRREDADQREDLEHSRSLLSDLLEMVRPLFSRATWKAFHRVAIDGATTIEVSHELNMSVNAVRIAKCRVIGVLRQAARRKKR